MGLFRTLFPARFSRKQHACAMKEHLPRIVASHSSGNIHLQSGRYVDDAALSEWRAKARKAFL